MYLTVDKSTGNIHILSSSPEENPWQRGIAHAAALCGGSVWALPLWIVPDGRHKQAAEVALMGALRLPALPTNGIHTLLSIAGEILDLPIFDTVIRPEHAELALTQISLSKSTDAYKAAWNTPGFAQSFWTAVQEAESHGHFPDETLPAAAGSPPPPLFRELHHLLKAHFDRINRLTPGEFLRRARKKLLKGNAKFDAGTPLVIGPLFDLNPLELEFIRALITHADSLHILPVQGSRWTDELGMRSQPSNKHAQSAANIHLTRPLTPESEIDNVFTQIAEWVATGKYKYRDIRIVHPFINEALPQIRSAARRYRVPLRTSTSVSLAEFPGVSQLEKLLDLFAGNWKRTDILGLLRSDIIGAPQAEVSKLITRILETGEAAASPPAQHWIKLAEKNGASTISAELKRLQELDIVGRSRQTSADFAEWVKRCIEIIKQSLSDWPGLAFEDEQARRSEVRGWETLDNHLKHFSTCFPHPMDRSILIKRMKGAIQSCKYTPVDRRLDAVEVCPGTREDHLPVPVVFYISLNSRVPAPRKASPFLKDEPRPDYDEKFALFRLLIENGSDEIYLSCPKFDDEGNELTLSPFINSLQNRIGHILPQKSIASWRPFATRDGHRPPTMGKKTRVESAQALAYLRERSHHWSVTQLNDAIQCPYLHFARHLLCLCPLEDQIAQGVTPLILGSIAHKALEEFLKKLIEGKPFDLESWVRIRFKEQTSRFPAHPEADRELEEMVRNLTEFIDRGWARLSTQFVPRVTEWGFGGKSSNPTLELDVPGGRISIEGRIDRIDVAKDGSVLITDYKYSRMDSQKKSEFFAGLDEGIALQLPLYAQAVEKLWHKNVAALLQIHLRSGSILGIRREDVRDLAGVDEKGSDVRELSVEEIGYIYSRTTEKLAKMAESAASGQIPTAPADFQKCGPGNCDFADLCRYRQRWQKFI